MEVGRGAWDRWEAVLRGSGLAVMGALFVV